MVLMPSGAVGNKATKRGYPAGRITATGTAWGDHITLLTRGAGEAGTRSGITRDQDRSAELETGEAGRSLLSWESAERSAVDWSTW